MPGERTMVRNAMTYLAENYVYPFNAAETAAAVNVNQSHLRECLKNG
jgi:hypothetical protein